MTSTAVFPECAKCGKGLEHGYTIHGNDAVTYCGNCIRGMVVPAETPIWQFPEPALVELKTPYQIICTIHGVKLWEAQEWLSEQIGYKFDNGDEIVSIDHFQFIDLDGLWDCVATCRVQDA